MVEKYNIEELIIRFLKQEISEDELRYLETWLAENEEHKSQFFELKNVSDLFDHSIVTSNNADWQKMYDRIERIHEKVPSHIESPMGDSVWLSVLKYAAIAILALGLGWGVGSFYSTPVVHEENVFALNEIHVPKGGRTNTVVLSDGTKVILNAGTTFKYPNLFKNGSGKYAYKFAKEHYNEPHSITTMRELSMMDRDPEIYQNYLQLLSMYQGKNVTFEEAKLLAQNSEKRKQRTYQVSQRMLAQLYVDKKSR